MLLPLEVNKFVDNKDWAVKYLHYCHVGKPNERELRDLRNSANKKGIVLSKKATDELSKIDYNRSVDPVLSVREAGAWDAELIANRTQQIKELTWETLSSWLRP